MRFTFTTYMSVLDCTVIRLHHPALTLAGAAGLSKRQQQLFDATQLRRLNVKAERKQRTPASIGKGIGLLTPTFMTNQVTSHQMAMNAGMLIQG